MLTMQGSFYHCYVLPFLAGGHAVAFDALYLLKSKEESFHLKLILMECVYQLICSRYF